jgi:hypothetical protein
MRVRGVGGGVVHARPLCLSLSLSLPKPALFLAPRPMFCFVVAASLLRFAALYCAVEPALLAAHAKARDDLQKQVAMERAEAADWLMRMLEVCVWV